MSTPTRASRAGWPRRLRTWHRWIAVVVGLQLLTWTVSGLVFSWDPIEEVRGETLLAEAPARPLPDPGGLVPLAQAWAAAHAAGKAATAHVAGPPTGSAATTAALEWQRDRWCWVLRADDRPPCVIGATSGRFLGELSADEARTLAAASVTIDAAPIAVERLTQAAGEYRAKPVPAWRVAFDDDEATAVYLDAWTGAVTAVRTDTWRRFDWFWMLHIMDYDTRTDFHTPLLTGAALLGVAASLTGILLAVVVLRPRRRVRP